MWEVEVTDQFMEWWSTLSDAQREAVNERVDLLQSEAGSDSVGCGPDPQFPSSVDERTASGQGWSVASAVLVRPAAAGDPVSRWRKSGEWNDWYAWAVPRADDLYDEYLGELGEEGLI